MHSYCDSLRMYKTYIQGDEEKARGLKPVKMMDRDFHNELPSCQVRIVRHACPLVHSCITHIRTLTRFSPCSFQTITESLVHHRCTFHYPHAVLLYISLYKWKGCFGYPSFLLSALLSTVESHYPL